jgi:leucyl aminopeptidase (aminopeptidase T)
MGGTVDVPFHVDGILLRPTLELDGEAILRDGRPLFD